MQPRSTCRLAVALAAAAFTGLTGCAQLFGPGGLNPGLTTGAAPTFNGAQVAAPVGSVPNLNQSGAPGASPTAQIVPAGSQPLVDAVKAKYGFQVYGAGATPDNLQILEQGLQGFQTAKHFKGLTSVEILTAPPADDPGLGGLWDNTHPGDNSPRSQATATIKLYAAPGGTPDATKISAYTVAHEIGHHVCEQSAYDDFRLPWEKELKTSPQPYPTEYAKTPDDGGEFLAENLAVVLRGTTELGPDLLPGYVMADAAKARASQEFTQIKL